MRNTVDASSISFGSRSLAKGCVLWLIYCGVEKRLSHLPHKQKTGCSTQPSRNQSLCLYISTTSSLKTTCKNGFVIKFLPEDEFTVVKRYLWNTVIEQPHLYGPVVQLVRTLACHARGRRFEPVPGRHKLG